MANGICDGSCLCIRSITMRRVHTLGWRRTRRYDEPSNDLGPLSPHQSCPAYIIDTRGYDSREGQVDHWPPGQGILATNGLPRTPVVPENSIRMDSRDEAESAHHAAQCLHSFSCLGRLSPACSSRGSGSKSRISFSAISSILR